MRAPSLDMGPFALLPPGLIGLLYFDQRIAMQLASTENLQRLALPSDQSLASALENTRAALAPLDGAMQPLEPGEAPGFAGGDDEASRLLFPADWAATAVRCGGHFLVCVPSAEMVLYGNGSGPAALLRVAVAAREEFDRAQRPISAIVLEWLPNGWRIAGAAP